MLIDPRWFVLHRSHWPDGYSLPIHVFPSESMDFASVHMCFGVFVLPVSLNDYSLILFFKPWPIWFLILYTHVPRWQVDKLVIPFTIHASACVKLTGSTFYCCFWPTVLDCLFHYVTQVNSGSGHYQIYTIEMMRSVSQTLQTWGATRGGLVIILAPACIPLFTVTILDPVSCLYLPAPSPISTIVP